MGRGKQWSHQTTEDVKSLMALGIPLPRIASRTGVKLQTLRSFSARLKKGLIGAKHSNHRGGHSKQCAEMQAWTSDFLTTHPGASISQVAAELKNAGFATALSRTTVWRMMRKKHRPVKPVRAQIVKKENCQKRKEFCLDVLSRWHRFEQLNGIRRRMKVKLRPVPDSMALDVKRLCFQDETLVRCKQSLVAQQQRVWIDATMSKGTASKDTELAKHMIHRNSQNNPGTMVSGVVSMDKGPLGQLFIVPPGVKISTASWLEVMQQHVIPECEIVPNFLCVLDNAPSHASKDAKAWYEENMPHTGGAVLFQPPSSPDLNLLDIHFWRELKRNLAPSYATTVAGKIALRRDIQVQWEKLKLTSSMSKIVQNWRRRLEFCLQREGEVFEHLM